MVRKFATGIFERNDANGATRTRRGALLVLAVSGLLLLTVVQGCGSQAGRGTSDSLGQSEQDLGGTIICGTYSTVDAKGRSRQRPEYYIVHSMNRKLRYFPEFASAIGMRSVKTCDEARAFAAAYTQYFALHPYFDKSLPIDLPDERLARLPSQLDAVTPVPKIFNGMPAGPPVGSGAPYPVVNIWHHFDMGAQYFGGHGPVLFNPGPGEHVGDKFDDFCSGTFISKNFILTAAHCIEDLALTYDPALLGSSQWITAATWNIAWPHDTGIAFDPKIGSGGMMHLETRAVSVVHPSYAGLLPVVYPNDPNHSVFGPYDIAILYIPSVLNDYRLPADAAVSSWDLQSGVADSAFSNWSLSAYGYGGTDDNQNNVGVLTAVLGGPPLGVNFTTTPGPPSSAPATEFTSTIQTVSNAWGLCEGDSGGPLVREALNPNTPGGIDHVIVGVASNGSGSGHCDSAVGDSSVWARTDVAEPYISHLATLWYPGFDVSRTTFGIGANSYVKLHGASCQSNCGCLDKNGKPDPGQVCFNPATDPDSRSSPLSGVAAACLNNQCADCSCVMGQCLPAPNSTGGAGSSSSGSGSSSGASMNCPLP